MKISDSLSAEVEWELQVQIMPGKWQLWGFPEADLATIRRYRADATSPTYKLPIRIVKVTREVVPKEEIDA